MNTLVQRQWKGIIWQSGRLHGSTAPLRHGRRPRLSRIRFHSDVTALRTTNARLPSDTTVVLWTSVLPAPQASAAGVRTLGILGQLLTNKTQGVASVHVVAPNLPDKQSSSPSEDKEAIKETMHQLEGQGVCFHAIPANRENDTRDFLQSLPQHDNLLCCFDRFFTEEMYSFHVHRHAPKATMVLDMQDMHSLRRSRQRAVQMTEENNLDEGITAGLKAVPDAEDSDLLRELASIHRMDLTMVCSPHEKTLLEMHYGISPEKLVLAPLLGTTGDTPHGTPSWNQRQDVCFVGGFRHDPNVDAVEQLLRLWPRIRQQVEERGTERDLPWLHIYGAFLTPALRQKWHAKLRQVAQIPDPESCGISMAGFVSDLSQVLLDHRLMLAPLRYGAGLKGKLVEAWQAGLPVVSTPIGAEGFFHHKAFHSFPGYVASSDESFVKAVVELYTCRDSWNRAHERTKQTQQPVADTKGNIRMSGNGSRHSGINDENTTRCWRNWLNIAEAWPSVAGRLSEAMERMPERRKRDTTRAILWRETFRSTEYFSKYIEQKEMNK